MVNSTIFTSYGICSKLSIQDSTLSHSLYSLGGSKGAARGKGAMGRGARLKSARGPTLGPWGIATIALGGMRL